MEYHHLGMMRTDTSKEGVRPRLRSSVLEDEKTDLAEEKVHEATLKLGKQQDK